MATMLIATHLSPHNWMPNLKWQCFQKDTPATITADLPSSLCS